LFEYRQKINIEGRDIYLMRPDNREVEWVGHNELQTRLKAAWLSIDASDLPMNPVIVGPPGSGKTTMIAAMAADLKQPLYIFQCTMDTRPEDLLITPVLNEHKEIRYQASPLVTAMLEGGVCILDEGNRMRDKAWASLAPLLDSRRYVESVITGLKIHADPAFRIASTMNEDSSTYQLPEYIRSRLRPRLEMPDPDAKTIEQIIVSNLRTIQSEVLARVMTFLKKSMSVQKNFSLRQAIQIAAFVSKRLKQQPDADVELLLQESIELNAGREAMNVYNDVVR